MLSIRGYGIIWDSGLSASRPFACPCGSCICFLCIPLQWIPFLFSFQCFWCMDGCALEVRKAALKSWLPLEEPQVQYVGSKMFALEASLVLFRNVIECELLILRKDAFGEWAVLFSLPSQQLRLLLLFDRDWWPSCFSRWCSEDRKSSADSYCWTVSPRWGWWREGG